ncbi:MAG: segregation and condensation protein A [Acidimicrobiales bacterium]
MPYEVRTPVFEGPFDLLFQLITSQQVDLWEVSIARIVDSFVEHCAALDQLDLELATEFALIAASLLELKCRRLLPSAVDPTLEEELAASPERDALLGRLVECAAFRDAGRALGELASRAELSLPRVAGLEEPYASMVPDILAGVGPEDLLRAMLRALSPPPTPPRVDVSHLPLSPVSLEEAAAGLARALAAADGGTARFASLVAGGSRLEVVAAFLAALQLFKEGLVELTQASTFAELWLSWRAGDPETALQVVRWE